jgi:hypothetical protein
VTRLPAAVLGTIGASCIALACSGGGPDESNVARGRGLRPLPLSSAAEAAVYDAAARASFDVGPDLVLMAHPRRLPRTAGFDGGEPLPSALLQALRDRGVVRGRCDPQHEVPLDTPRCPGAQAGYVIRGSPVVRVGGDTIQLNFAAEAFAAASGQRPQALRFEKIYQLVGSGTTWRVVREARVRTG